MERLPVKLAVLVAGLLGRIYLPYLVLGLWNRAFGGWRSVFFCYAGRASHRDAYAPGPIAELFRWVPNPIGVLRQGRSRSLVFASPMREADFLDPGNAARFRRFRRRLGRIAWLMGVRQIHLAGVLPSVLRGADDLAVHPSQGLTVKVVVAAVEEVLARAFDRPVPLILLGGAGYVGHGVTTALRGAGHEVHVVDHAIGVDALPDGLRGTPTLLVDLARPGALAEHLDVLWPGLVVLNEVFPEPSRQDVARFAKRGVALWHIAGVPGEVRPPLPGGYSGAVPCCAAHDPEADLSPVLRKL